MTHENRQHDEGPDLPEQKHVITCKKCGQKAHVSIRYTRLCSNCRNWWVDKPGKRIPSWDSWGEGQRTKEWRNK